MRGLLGRARALLGAGSRRRVVGARGPRRSGGSVTAWRIGFAAAAAVSAFFWITWASARPASAEHCVEPTEVHDGEGGCPVSGVTTTTTVAPTTTTTVEPVTTTTAAAVPSVVGLCATRDAEGEPCEPIDLTLVGSVVMVTGAVLGLSLAKAVRPSEEWLR